MLLDKGGKVGFTLRNHEVQGKVESVSVLVTFIFAELCYSCFLLCCFCFVLICFFSCPSFFCCDMQCFAVELGVHLHACVGGSSQYSKRS